MIENMSRNDFINLFSVKDNPNMMECFDETIKTSGMSWFDLARAQINTMNFLIRYKEMNGI